MEYKSHFVDMSKMVSFGGSVISQKIEPLRSLIYYQRINEKTKKHFTSDEINLSIMRHYEENNYDYDLELRNHEIIISTMRHYEENNYDYELKLN